MAVIPDCDEAQAGAVCNITDPVPENSLYGQSKPNRVATLLPCQHTGQ